MIKPNQKDPVSGTPAKGMFYFNWLGIIYDWMKVAKDLGLLRNQCYLPNIHDKYSQQYHRDNECHSQLEKPSPLSFAHTQSLPIILLTQSRSKASHLLTCFSSVYEHSTQPRQSSWSRRCSQDPPAKGSVLPHQPPCLDLSVSLS